ncbi:MAG: thermonuclease family protein [Candidatus Dadabacteria bacterium]|nr:thermonuclease family protein [Candidatus Dadabacteria bacterium]
MKPERKIVFILVFVVLAAVFHFYNNERQATGPDTGTVRVLDVIDGDTIVVDDGMKSRVRYLGIDTPELAWPDSPGDPLGAEAKEFNRKLVAGKDVRLEFDEEKYDVYGRLLAYVYADGVFVSGEMLRAGLASPLVIEPNRRHEDLLMEAAAEARQERKGIWGDLDTLAPPPGNGDFVVDPGKAERYEGKRVVVRGKVTGARKSRNVLVLDVEDELEVVIFPDDFGNFEFFGIDPAKDYEGKEIEVTGRVRVRKGKPGIVVAHPMLVRSPG